MVLIINYVQYISKALLQWILQNIWLSLLLIGVAFYLQYFWNYREFYKLARKLKGPFYVPIIGNAYMFLGDSKVVSQSFFPLMEKYKNEDMFRLWLGPKYLIIFINKPEYVEVILNCSKALQKNFVYKNFELWIETGLLTASVDKWKYHRKIITPAFNQKILDSFCAIFQEKSRILVQSLQQEIGKTYFDVFPYISRCTLDTTIETTLGIPSSNQTEESLITHYIDRVLHMVIEKTFKYWFYPDSVYFKTFIGVNARKYLQYLMNYTQNIINQKRDEYNQKKTSVNVDSRPSFSRKPFLQLLIENTYFSDEEIREEVSTITAAGNDTTANAVSSVLLCLAMFPDVQEKVHEEILGVFGKSDCVMELSDLSKFKYLDMVIKESLRIMPVAPIIFRETTDDIALDSFVLPKGCSICIPIYNLHRNSNNWPDPEKFIPERFESEENSKRHPYTFIPFSAGPRNCIGMRYANMVMKYILVHLLRAYKFRTHLTMDQLVYMLSVTLSLESGHMVSIEQR